MSLSPECAKQHDRETASIKTILTLAAVGSVGIHGLAWAISAVLPAPVTVQENAPIELILVSDPAEERIEPEDPLDLEEPAQPLKPELGNFNRIENPTASSSDFLTAAAQLAPDSSPVPPPSLSQPPELAVAPPAPDPMLLFESESERWDLETEIAKEPESSAPKSKLAPEPESQPEDRIEASEWEALETQEENTAEVEEPQSPEEVADTEIDSTEAIATEPEQLAKTDPEETQSPLNEPSLLDKIKDLRARARRDLFDQRTAATNRGSDRSTDRSIETAQRSTADATAVPNGPRTGQASASPAESRDIASAGHSNSNPKPLMEAGSHQSQGEPIAAREPTSQSEGHRNRPARRTITCRRCSKPKFSKRELEGAEGATQFELVTDARGRVVEVVVTQSSGNAAVDEKTIRHIKKRWRFESTSGGATVPVTVDMAIEGSDYYREREAAQPKERLEYETPLEPAHAFDGSLPTAATEPSLVEMSPDSSSAEIPPERSSPSAPQLKPAAEPETPNSPAPESAHTLELKQESPGLNGPDAVFEPEPVVEPVPYSAPAPNVPDAVFEPEPAFEAEPVFEPEPVVEPVPYSAPAPYFESDPVYEPESHYTPEPVYEETHSENPELYYNPEPVDENPAGSKSG